MIFQIIYNVAIALIVLSTIVSIHELGHYLVGRLCNLKIREFSVGMLGVKFLPKIVDSRKTIWRIGLLPIGGYVSFVEKDENKKNSDNSNEYDILQEVEEKQNLLGMIKSRISEFFEVFKSSAGFIFLKRIGSKIKKASKLVLDKTNYPNSEITGSYLEELHPLKKIALALAGPIANFILGFVIFASLYVFIGRDEKQVCFVDNGHAYKAKDVVLKVNGLSVLNSQQMKSLENKNSLNIIDFMRDGNVIQTSVVSLPNTEDVNLGIIKLDFYTAIRKATEDLINIIILSFNNILSIFGRMFNFDFKGTEKLSGIIGIVQKGFKEIDKGFYFTMKWMAVLSISIGVLNLLIIPPFDGSFIILGLSEIIIGKRQKVEDLFSEIAMIVIIFFAFLTIRNDIFLKNQRDKEAKAEIEKVKEKSAKEVV